jgi:acetyl-CoA acetyltransferase
VLIVGGVRTAIAKARRGAFKETTPDALLAPVLKAVQERSGVPMHAIGDICVGELTACAAGPAKEAVYLVDRGSVALLGLYPAASPH